MTNKEGLLIVLSAPSGGGKTTLCERLMAADANVVRSVSCTTRAPRVGEVDGESYVFLSREEFEKRIARDEFLEYALVHGNYYGTLEKTVEDLLAKGHDVVLTIDVQGAEIVRKIAAKEACIDQALVEVFLMPPSIEVLEKRLRKRNTDDDATIARRLDEARREMPHWNKYDYVIVSGTPEEDHRRLAAILEAERLRTTRSSFPEVS
ncbi:MAG: guanylate kinase [Verrucomicrobia bacterium]|nr:guanylate kinase [Verrucomicrobiota bacterium]